MLQRVRIFVTSKQDIWVLQELLADLENTKGQGFVLRKKTHHVANGVVLLVDGEYCRIGHLQESVEGEPIVWNHVENKYK